MSRAEMIAQAGAGVTARGRDARQRSRRHSDHRSRLGRGVVARGSARSQRRADHAVGTHTQTFRAMPVRRQRLQRRGLPWRPAGRRHAPTADRPHRLRKSGTSRSWDASNTAPDIRSPVEGTGIHRPNPIRTDASGVRKAHHWLRMRAHGDRRLTRLAYAEVLPDEKATTAVAFLRRSTAFYARHGITVQPLLTDGKSSGEIGQVVGSLFVVPVTDGAKSRFWGCQPVARLCPSRAF